MLGATIATACISVLVIAIRYYVRKFMIRAIGWDDYVMLLSLALVSTPTESEDAH